MSVRDRCRSGVQVASGQLGQFYRWWGGGGHLIRWGGLGRTPDQERKVGDNASAPQCLKSIV